MRKPGLLFLNSGPTHSTSLGWFVYRCGLALAGILWVCLATTLCGCNQANGWMVNRSGMAYFRQGNYDAARFEFERALVNNPYRADYAFNIAKTMEAQGDLEGAEQMYQYALTADPAHELSYHGLAGMLIDQGRESDAQTLLQAWAETQPYLPESNVEYARWQQRQGDMAGAQQSLTRALMVNPHDPHTLGQMGQFYEQSQQPALAAAYYQQSLMLKPNQPEVKTRLSNIGWTPGQSPAQNLANRISIMDPTMNGGVTLAGGTRRYFNQSPLSYGPTIAPVGAWQYGPSPAGNGSTVPMMGTRPMPPGMPAGMGPAPYGPTYMNPQMSMPLNYNTSQFSTPDQMSYSTAMMPGTYGSDPSISAGMYPGPGVGPQPGMTQYGSPGVPTMTYQMPQQPGMTPEVSYAPQQWSGASMPMTSPAFSSAPPVEQMMASPALPAPAMTGTPQEYVPALSPGMYSPPPQMSTAPSVQAF